MESNRSYNVAVIAEEMKDRLLLIQLLQKAGYSAGFFANSESLLETATATAHQAMIVCHRSRHNSHQVGVPRCTKGQRVVVLSDCTAESSIVSALEKGAHHYFDIAQKPALLQARLEAALRQHSLSTRRVLDVEPFKFNLERRCVYREGKLINLSPKEYEFAYYLFANRHRVVINSELMTSVWSLPSSMDARRIDTAACRVRKKMQLSESSSGWCLQRIRRVGYELLWRGEVQNLNTDNVSDTAEKSSMKIVHAPERPVNEEHAHVSAPIYESA